jgi:hypothetical protein
MIEVWAYLLSRNMPDQRLWRLSLLYHVGTHMVIFPVGILGLEALHCSLIISPHYTLRTALSSYLYPAHLPQTRLFGASSLYRPVLHIYTPALILCYRTLFGKALITAFRAWHQEGWFRLAWIGMGLILDILCFNVLFAFSSYLPSKCHIGSPPSASPATSYRPI